MAPKPWAQHVGREAVGGAWSEKSGAAASLFWRDKAEHVVLEVRAVAWLRGPRPSQNAGWQWPQAGTVHAGRPG
jgi:hypothetical protein